MNKTKFKLYVSVVLLSGSILLASAAEPAARTLTIGPRKGLFHGMVAERKLNIVIASPDQNVGMVEGSFNVKTVNYTGKTVKMKF
jgi:hypothetical protein